MNHEAHERETAQARLEAADRARTQRDADRATRTARRAGTAPTTEPTRPHTAPKTAMSSLTAPERETVITYSDADHTALVVTAQRRTITRLRKLAAAGACTIDEEGFHGGTEWVRATIHDARRSISLRAPLVLSEEARRERGTRLKQARSENALQE